MKFIVTMSIEVEADPLDIIPQITDAKNRLEGEFRGAKVRVLPGYNLVGK